MDAELPEFPELGDLLDDIVSRHELFDFLPATLDGDE